MDKTHTITLSKFLTMGDGSCSIADDHPLTDRYANDIHIEVMDDPTVEGIGEEVTIIPTITLVGWKLGRHTPGVEEEISANGGEEAFTRMLTIILEDTRFYPRQVSYLSALREYDLGWLSSQVIDRLSGEELQEALESAIGDLQAGWGSREYLNFMRATFMGQASSWEQAAFGEPRFVAWLQEVQMLRDLDEVVMARAGELFGRASVPAGQDSRPVHHLVRFFRNVEALDELYAVNPLGPGVQLILFGSGGDALDLDQLPLAMACSFREERPVLELVFPPLKAYDTGKKSVQWGGSRIRERLKRFYTELSGTLAFFHELGELEQVEMVIDGGCPTFRFLLAGNPQASVPYREDETLQTHLLYNLAETFHQRRMLLQVASIMAADGRRSTSPDASNLRGRL